MCSTTGYHRMCQCSVSGMLLLSMVSMLVPSVTNAQQAAPATEGVIVNKIEDLVGIWESQHGDSGAKAYRQYEADGTIREAYSLDNLQTSPLHIGHVWFENNVYYQKNDHPLAPDSPGKYEVRIHKAKGVPDRLSFRLIDDADKFRVKDFAAGMTRVEPALQASEKIVSTVEELVGIWEGWMMGRVVYRQFEADGTLKCAGKVEWLQDPSALTYSGKFWFEGEMLKITESLQPNPGAYKVQIRKRDSKSVHLSFHDMGDPDSMRAHDWGRGMTRVEP